MLTCRYSMSIPLLFEQTSAALGLLPCTRQPSGVAYRPAECCCVWSNDPVFRYPLPRVQIFTPDRSHPALPVRAWSVPAIHDGAAVVLLSARAVLGLGRFCPGQDSERCTAAMNQSLSPLQNPATTICNILQKNYDEHIDNGGENAKRKRGDSRHGRRRCRRQADSRATKNIVYHWSSANRVGPRFYLRFLELCNKMKVNVDPIKVMNGDKND